MIDWALFKAPEFFNFLTQGVKVIIHFLPDESQSKDSDGSDFDSDEDDEDAGHSSSGEEDQRRYGLGAKEDDDDEEEDSSLQHHNRHAFQRIKSKHIEQYEQRMSKKPVEKKEVEEFTERTRRVIRVLFLTDNKTNLKLMRLVGEQLVEGLLSLSFSFYI